MAVESVVLFSVMNANEDWGFVRVVVPLVILCVIVVKLKPDEGLILQPLMTVLLYFIHRTIQKHEEDKTEIVVKKRSKRKKDQPVSSEPVKKCSKRASRRKNKSNDGSTSMPVLPEKTKVYLPLEIYTRMNWDPDNLYLAIARQELTRDQLTLNGFPGYAPPRGAVATSHGLRDCVRCGQQFKVSESGQYLSSSGPCFFHSRKLQFPEAAYPCCKRPFGGKGCEYFPKHVTVQHLEADFLQVPYKRQVRRDHLYRVYALDCEMCYTTGGLEVTKIGVVGVDGLTEYETFVLPEYEVLDYNTEYSGVTADDLKGTATTIQDVRFFLMKLLNQDSILVGHALDNDLRALGIVHNRIVDTSVMFRRSNNTKRSLKNLAQEYLSRTIQKDRHDCIVDARTAMELVLWKVNEPVGRPLPNPRFILPQIPNLFSFSLPPALDENRNGFLLNCAELEKDADPWESEGSIAHWLETTGVRHPFFRLITFRCTSSFFTADASHFYSAQNGPYHKEVFDFENKLQRTFTTANNKLLGAVIRYNAIMELEKYYFERYSKLELASRYVKGFHLPTRIVQGHHVLVDVA